MKTIRFLAIALLAGGLFTACDKDDNGYPGKGSNADMGDIVFNITIGNPSDHAGDGIKTKTTTTSDFRTTFVDGDQIGIYAVSHAAGTPGTLAASGNAIHNVKLTYNATSQTWTPATALYYSGAQMDFYAYYPYDAAATDPTNITFNVNADQSIVANYNVSDLLSASAANIAPSPTPVTLTFSHVLALVQVEVDPTYIDRNGNFAVTLRGCKAGGIFNLGTGSLTTTGNAVAVKMLRVEQPGDANYSTKYSYRALVPAQTVAQNTSLCLMAQNGQFYNMPTLTAALDLSVGDAKLYTATLPATAIQTVKITKGTFQMGSSNGSNIGNGNGSGLNTTPAEPNRYNTETQHKVTLTKDFQMSRYAVTFAQYDAFCDATGRSKPGDSGWGRGDRPVINVSWHDAVAYCAWLSEQTGQTWTLPTEAQWEYACRAGTTTPFSLGTAGDGNSFVSTQGNFLWSYPYDVAQNGGYNDNTKTPLQRTQPVGSYAPNTWGLYDMHGNVWEWCLDQRDGSDNYLSLPDTDPLCTSGSYRVLRGGGWGDGAQDCRSANRSFSYPVLAFTDVGFRVVLAPSN